MTVLGRELLSRGHRVVFAVVSDSLAAVTVAGLEAMPIGEHAFPLGSVPELHAQLGRLSGRRALDFTLSFMARLGIVLLDEAPELFRGIGAEILLVDQAAPGGNGVSRLLELPFVSIANALLFNLEPSVPPLAWGWGYSTSMLALWRNRLGYAILDHATAPLRRALDDRHSQLGLPRTRGINNSFSPWAQISQQPPEFEFPRRDLPPHFHFAGPFQDPAARPKVPFPFERLDGRPLVYASLGTLQNRLLWIFRIIAEACARLPIQLVISLGGSAEPDSIGELPGDPIVVRSAPQLELIPRSTLVITHAGLNTALESLAHGIPMVAIPITNDQPGVAARIAWTGTGVVIPPRRLNVPRLRTATARVLGEPSFRYRSGVMQRAIARTEGARYAALVIEEVLRTGRPVVTPNRG
jgi:UDP:flavonoid glycosyltransferase YjiC (YdhE family)